MIQRPAVILMSLVVLLGLCGCEPETSGDSAELIRPHSQFARHTDQLREEFVAYEPVSARRDSDCRRVINSMVYSARTDEQARDLSDTVAALLMESEQFQMYDYELLRIAGGPLATTPPRSNTYLLTLAEKVQNALDDPTAPDAYRTKYASIAIGVLLDTVHYPGRVETFDDNVNTRQWADCYAWLGENFDDLFYDEPTGTYRLTASTPEE
jgi:hypothetical protein